MAPSVSQVGTPLSIGVSSLVGIIAQCFDKIEQSTFKRCIVALELLLRRPIWRLFMTSTSSTSVPPSPPSPTFGAGIIALTNASSAAGSFFEAQSIKVSGAAILARVLSKNPGFCLGRWWRIYQAFNQKNAHRHSWVRNTTIHPSTSKVIRGQTLVWLSWETQRNLAVLMTCSRRLFLYKIDKVRRWASLMTWWCGNKSLLSWPGLLNNCCKIGKVRPEIKSGNLMVNKA